MNIQLTEVIADVMGQKRGFALSGGGFRAACFLVAR
jgi:hypothetical protein